MQESHIGEKVKVFTETNSKGSPLNLRKRNCLFRLQQEFMIQLKLTEGSVVGNCMQKRVNTPALQH